MATFNAYVIVHGDAGPVQFAPGDEVPEWAEVGDHVLADPVETEEVPDTAGAKAEEADAADEAQSEDEEPEPPADAPDFTAAAPRRSRPRK